MASYEALGFAKGFFNQRTRMAEAEQAKQDKLQEKLQAMHIKGMEKRIEEHQKRKAAFAKVQGHLKGGDVAGAFGVYSSAISGMSAKERKAALGEDWVWSGNEAKTKAQLEEAINKYNKRPEPTFDTKSIQDIQVQRGVDNLEFESFIRDSFGLDRGEYLGTPYKGVKTGAYEEEAAASAGLWKRKPEGGDKMKTNMIPVTNKDGSVTVYRVDSNKTSESIRPIIGKQPEKQVRQIPKQEIAIYDSMLNQRELELKNDNTLSENVKENLSTMINEDESKPIHSAILSEVMSLQSKDSTIGTEEAFNKAWETVKANAPYAIQQADEGYAWGLFGEKYTWKSQVKVQSPDGRVVLVPWNKVNDAVNNGGKVIK